MSEYQYYEFVVDRPLDGRRIADLKAEHRRKPAFLQRPAAAGL